MNKGWLLSVALLINATLNAHDPKKLNALIAQRTTHAEQLQSLIQKDAPSQEIEALSKEIEQLDKQINTEITTQTEAQGSCAAQEQSAGTHQEDAAEQETNNTPTQTTTHQTDKQQDNPITQKLNIVHQALTNLFHGFIDLQLSTEDKVLLDELRLSLNALTTTISPNLPQEQITQKIELLLLLCTLQTTLQAKVELLATKFSLTSRQIQHLNILTLKNLSDQLGRIWPQIAHKKNKDNAQLYNRNITGHLAIIVIAELQSHWIARVFRLTEHACTLNEMFYYFSYDYYTSYPHLYMGYEKIMHQYRSGNYTQQGQALTLFLNDLNRITMAHIEERQTIAAQLTDGNISNREKKDLRKAQTIITLFINKLLTIKNEILSLCPQEGTDASKAVIHLRALAIAKNPQLKKLLTHDATFATFYNQFQKIITIFTSHDKLSNQAMCEMVYTMDTLQKHLKYNEKTWKGVLWSKIWSGPDTAYLLISEMAAALENLSALLLQKTDDPFARGLLTFTLISPSTSNEEPMSPGKRIIVEAAQQITGQKFTNFKDVFMYAMCYVSPYLAAYVLSWALPYLAQEVRQPIVSYFAQQKGAAPTKDQLSSLVTQHPAILEELGKLSPSFLGLGTGSQGMQTT